MTYSYKYKYDSNKWYRNPVYYQGLTRPLTILFAHIFYEGKYRKPFGVILRYNESGI